jgi:hypothetical protein
MFRTVREIPRTVRNINVYYYVYNSPPFTLSTARSIQSTTSHQN